MNRVCASQAGAVLVLALFAAVGAAGEPGTIRKDDAAILFREQVRPVLENKCLTCHGGEKKKGHLDLSRRASALTGGESGPAIVPGKAAGSLLYQRLTAKEMPPQNPLTPRQIAAFRQWIEAGAPYPEEPLVAAVKRAGPDWWAFQPVKEPAVPHGKFDSLVRNPIDSFLFARLADKGLKPSPPAARVALLRRVTFDLTGLPPTPEEVDAFLADNSSEAYEKVVDRLLASSAYGERWARHWLDVVRFGESNGYEQNHLRPNAWPYRDYVIRALNDDIPYTQFITEQLAGDVVGKGNPRVEPATGFLVAGVHDTVGNSTLEGRLQERANDLDDMVGTVGATFLGLTVSCARCHDHKFDPIPQKDYYRLAAVFSGVHHADRPITPAVRREEDRERAELAKRRLFRTWGLWVDLAGEARKNVLRSQGITPVPRYAIHIARNVEDFLPVKAKFVRFTVLATMKGDEPCLDEIEVYGPDSLDNVALAENGAKATASSLLPGYPIHQIHHLNDGKYGNEWSWISNERGKGWAQIELPEEQTINRVIWSREAMIAPRFGDRLPSKYRVEVSLDGKEWKTVATGDDRAAAQESIPHATLYKALSPEHQKIWVKLVEEMARLSKELPPEPKTLLAYAGQFATPEPIFLLKRGDVMQKGDPVEPGALSQLPGLPADLGPEAKQSEAGRRLALARWIADPKNPLTARVLVNRVWQGHFGQGLVSTPSDFGFNGGRPSHPELLDWLAHDFMANGWKLKRLHRMMVTSAAYRQNSDASPEGLTADAGNQLLWRMPLRRLEAEAVRDAILAVSGKLDRTMGGPGFRLFKYKVVNVAIYEPLDEPGPETWRRTIYQQSARAIRDDLLASFDCPECAQRAPRREVTTTPLQALSLLNGPFTQQQASFFAERVRREAGPEPEEQVRQAFRLAFGRPPTESEQRLALAAVARQGLPALCRVLINANEFLYY